MLNEETLYMKACRLNYNDFCAIDFELLCSFVESLFQSQLKEKVRVKFKWRGTFSTVKHGSVSIVREKGITKEVLRFEKDGTISIPMEVTDDESSVVSKCFKRWCDVLQFEKYREENKYE